MHLILYLYAADVVPTTPPTLPPSEVSYSHHSPEDPHEGSRHVTLSAGMDESTYAKLGEGRVNTNNDDNARHNRIKKQKPPEGGLKLHKCSTVSQTQVWQML